MGKGTRRGRGQGTITLLDDGRWQGRVSHVDGTGKRRRTVFYGKTKIETMEKVRAHQARASTGQTIDAGSMTISAYLDNWLSSRRASIEDETYGSYARQVEKYLKPHIGRIKLAKFTASHVERMFASMEKAGVSASMQNRVGITLSTALQYAVHPLRLIPHNPAAAVPKPRAKKAEMLCLGPAQAKAFLEAAKGCRFPHAYPLWIGSMARWGELFALTWADVDIDGKAIQITKTLQDIAGVFKTKDTKTLRGRRRVALPDFAVDALRACRKDAEACGRYGPGKPLFYSNSGGYVGRAMFHRKSFKIVLAKAMLADPTIPKIRPYDMRHTGATLLLLAGVSPKVVSERLGHSTTAMTMDVYSHVLPGMQEAAADKLQGLLG